MLMRFAEMSPAKSDLQTIGEAYSDLTGNVEVREHLYRNGPQRGVGVCFAVFALFCVTAQGNYRAVIPAQIEGAAR
jgi:hypothetical protein